jgi:predicted transcriptional regulator
MKTVDIKSDLHHKIDRAATKQLKDIYGLIINYLNGHSATEEWDSLSEKQKDAINTGLKQADAGLGKPITEVNQKLRSKYGIND